jgi:hypothetical protein
MKPHIRRHFLGKRLGWGWAIYMTSFAAYPYTTATSFETVCYIARNLSKGPANVQV